MRQRILISGGAGYVGRTLARKLYDDHDVLVLDSLRFGAGRISATDFGRIRLEAVDLRNTQRVAAVVGDFAPDVIVHLAAIHYIPECEADPATATSVNVVGTVNLLQAAPAGSRFVFASSGAVYAPEETPHREDGSPIAPSDVYGFTKLQGEQFVGHFARSRGLEAVVVRLFNVVGPGETNPHLLPEIVAQLKAGRDVVRLGNIWPKRDYVHVEDAAEGFAAAALDGHVAPGETATVNLGTGRQYSVEEILHRLRAAAGLDFAIEADPSRARAVDRPFLCADTGRMAERFGWQAKRDIDMAIADLWRAPDLSPALTAKYLPVQRVA